VLSTSSLHAKVPRNRSSSTRNRKIGKKTSSQGGHTSCFGSAEVTEVHADERGWYPPDDSRAKPREPAMPGLFCVMKLTAKRGCGQQETSHRVVGGRRRLSGRSSVVPPAVSRRDRLVGALRRPPLGPGPCSWSKKMKTENPVTASMTAPMMKPAGGRS
jgi:hypothetical protein